MRIASLFVPLSIVLITPGAHAFDYAHRCAGGVDTKDSGPLAETLNTCSIPHGSAAESAYLQTVDNWNAYSNIAVTASFEQSSCSINLGDWNNDVATVPRSQIGANGLTTYAHVNVCFSGGGGNYGATDVRLAGDLDFSTAHSNSEFYANSIGEPGLGRAVFVHEMGHQLGLGHSNYFNMMAAQSQMPTSPIGPVPYPDDVLGVVAVYGPKPVANLFASGQRWDGQSILNNHPIDETVCVGDTFLAQVTVANPGWQSASYAQQVLLSPDATGASPALVFNWADVTTQSEDWSQFAFSIPTSGVTLGSYFLIHKVDTNNQVAELREDDNLLAYTGKIIVADCTKALTLSTAAPLFL